MTWVKILGMAAAGALCVAPVKPAHAQEARVGGLVDVDFGTIPGIADQSKSQNVVVCSYRNKPQGLGYSVIASGTGIGGAFSLTAGAATLPYDVQWADSASQTGGRILQAGVPASGFGNAANGFDCPAQPDTASLTVTIRAADLASAQAGTYTGSLQLTIVPE